jgi:protein gp37
MTFATRFAAKGEPYEGLAYRNSSGAHWTGKVKFIEKHLTDPLKWRKPAKVFVNSMSDLFHESIPDEWIDKIFAVMALATQHTFQVLTKRPERMRDYVLSSIGNEDASNRIRVAINEIPAKIGDRKGALELPLFNVHLGVSCEDQKTADERIPLLLETPASVRWISAEPLLGPVNLDDYLYTRFEMGGARHMYNHLSWCVVGGESGPGSRPFDIAWARSIIRQCKAAGVPVFMKQLGAFPTAMTRHDSLDSQWAIQPNGHLRMILKSKKGGEISEWPEDLKVREFPEANGAILL